LTDYCIPISDVAKSSVIAAITNVKQCISQVRWRVRCLSQMTASDINRPSSTLLITLESNHANSSVNPQTSTSHLCLRKALLSDDCVIRSANRQCRCSRRRLELGLPGSERYSTISRFDRIWDRDVARRLKVCLWGGGTYTKTGLTGGLSRARQFGVKSGALTSTEKNCIWHLRRCNFPLSGLLALF